MSGISAQQTEKAIAGLLEQPAGGDALFSFDGVTIAEIFEIAAWLRANLPAKKRGEPVCLAAADRSLIAAALLASLAGGPVLVMPYAFSESALAGLSEATGARLAITDVPRALPEGMRAVRPRREASVPLLSSYPAVPQAELLRLYTGGSTGTPRIWSKTGINIFAESLFLAEHFRVSSADRIVATISPYHIYGLLYSVTLPLVSGAAVLTQTPSFPEEIVRAVQDQRATVLISVPAHYRALHGKSLAAPSLRLAFSSAGPLETAHNTDFCRNNRIEIVEVFGSTETGGIALRSRYREKDGFTPYPTIQWHCGDGGRLRVRSPYLSPELPVDDGGFFTTGDRVEVGDSMDFLLKGRADSIAKVAGNRVDLDEIASFIKTCPGVEDCLVLTVEERSGRQYRIVAMLEGGGVDVEEVKRKLARRFEPYALPRSIQVVERMPIKENGKHDRVKILRYFKR